VPALQPFLAVASVLLRFVLLFPRIRRLNISAVTAGLASSYTPRQYPARARPTPLPAAVGDTINPALAT
jgi:hypothetical protein